MESNYTGAHPIDEQRRNDETTGEFRTRTEWGGDERRKEGWTFWREVWGTMIGAAGIAIPVAIGFMSHEWAQDNIIERHDAQIKAIIVADEKDQRIRSERQVELNRRLDIFDGKLDRLIERK